MLLRQGEKPEGDDRWDESLALADLSVICRQPERQILTEIPGETSGFMVYSPPEMKRTVRERRNGRRMSYAVSALAGFSPAARFNEAPLLPGTATIDRGAGVV